MATQQSNEIPNILGQFLMARGIQFDSHQQPIAPMQWYKIEYVLEPCGYLITPA